MVDIPKASFLKTRAFAKPYFPDIKEGGTNLPGRMLSLKDFRKQYASGCSSPLRPLNSSVRFADISKIMDSPRTPRLLKSRSQLNSRICSPHPIVSPKRQQPDASFEPLTLNGIVGKQVQVSPRGKIVISIDSKLPYRSTTKTASPSSRMEGGGKGGKTVEKPSHLAVVSVEYQGKDSPRQLYVPQAHLTNE